MVTEYLHTSSKYQKALDETADFFASDPSSNDVFQRYGDIGMKHDPSGSGKNITDHYQNLIGRLQEAKEEGNFLDVVKELLPPRSVMSQEFQADVMMLVEQEARQNPELRAEAATVMARLNNKFSETIDNSAAHVFGQNAHNALASDPEIRAAVQNWDQLSLDEKEDFLGHANGIVAGSFGQTISGIEVVKNLGSDASTNDDGSGINFDKEYLENKSPEGILAALTHEYVHRGQLLLAEQYSNGELGPDHPRYSEAKVVTASLSSYENQDDDRRGDHYRYRGELVERIAFRVESSVLQALTAAFNNVRSAGREHAPEGNMSVQASVQETPSERDNPFGALDALIRGALSGINAENISAADHDGPQIVQDAREQSDRGIG